MNVKSVIFDLGGVILNIEYNKTLNAFQQLGVTGFHDMYSLQHSDSVFTALEKGNIDESNFCVKFREQAGVDLPDEVIIGAWNKLLLDFRENAINFIKQLRANYNVYLLSNTNIIHLHAFEESYRKSFGEELRDLFDTPYFSHEIGFRKPDTGAYRYVLDKNSLSANETIFIDDSLDNVEGARKAGLNAVHLKNGEFIEQKLAYLSDKNHLKPL